MNPTPAPDAMPPPTFTGQHALFLDFDGTLVELAERPDLVRTDVQLVPVLKACSAKVGGAMALVTGRRLESLDSSLAPLRTPAAGLHGAQRREVADGPTLDLTRPVNFAKQLSDRVAERPGLWVEDKGQALAIHYREAPELGVLALELLHETVKDSALEILSGKFVHEARPRGFNKGVALKQFMSRPPFAGRIPVFVGDDLTDEDAMQAAQSLGGFAIKVGLGQSCANHRLIDPQAVLLWLMAATQTRSPVAALA